MYKGLLRLREIHFIHISFPSIFFFLIIIILAFVTMTQTCHDALDLSCAKRESKEVPSPGGNRPSSVFSIQHTITKWIFDLEWYSHFLSPAMPWRTKQFSCYPSTTKTTLNRTSQHPCKHSTLQEIDSELLRVRRFTKDTVKQT